MLFRSAPNPSTDITTFKVRAAESPKLIDAEDADGVVRVCGGTNAVFVRGSSTGTINWYTDEGLDGNVVWLTDLGTNGTLSILPSSKYYRNGARFVARAVSAQCVSEFEDGDPVVLNIDLPPTIAIRSGDEWPTELCEGTRPTLRVTAGGANTVQWYDEGLNGSIKIAAGDGLSEFQLPAVTAGQSSHVIRALAIGIFGVY